MASVFTDSGEISGQSLEEFGQSGRRWLTAAGVVAALVAGLTVIAAATDSALAAPPATQVDVVNPATSPALTRSVDDPGRIAYQSTTTCVLNDTICSFDFPPVPKNHRLVVQHVSAS